MEQPRERRNERADAVFIPVNDAAPAAAQPRLARVKKRVFRLGKRIGNIPERRGTTLTGLGLLSVAGSIIMHGAPAVALGAFAATVLGGGALAAGVARAERRAKLRAQEQQKRVKGGG